MEKTIRLLAAAGVLMLLAGALFALIRQWVYAALPGRSAAWRRR